MAPGGNGISMSSLTRARALKGSEPQCLLHLALLGSASAYRKRPGLVGSASKEVCVCTQAVYMNTEFVCSFICMHISPSKPGGCVTNVCYCVCFSMYMTEYGCVEVWE